MVEKKHEKRKYKEGKIFQQKIKNTINEMTEIYFFGNINPCSSSPNRSMKISKDFSLERRHILKTN